MPAALYIDRSVQYPVTPPDLSSKSVVPFAACFMQSELMHAVTMLANDATLYKHTCTIKVQSTWVLSNGWNIPVLRAVTTFYSHRHRSFALWCEGITCASPSCDPRHLDFGLR